MKLYILRHGRTHWNEAGKLQGRTDIELNEEGRQSARQTGEQLKEIPFSAAFCSPLSRAKETAQLILQGKDTTLVADERLIELSFGEAEGACMAENPRWQTMVRKLFAAPDEDYDAPKGGEEYAALVARCRAFLEQTIIPKEKEWEHVLIVAHGGTLRGLFSAMLGKESDGLFQKHPPKNCAVNIVSCENGAFSVERLCDEYCEKL